MKLIINIVLSIVLSVLIVTTFQFYWNTFLAPAVGWNSIRWVQAAGINILLQIPFAGSLMRLLINTDESGNNTALAINTALLIVFAFMFAVGWALSLFL